MNRNKYSTPCNKKGFSLIETMIVLGIIVIMAAIGIPTFSRMLPDMRLRSAAQDLYANLQAAKLDAVQKNNNATDDTASNVIFHTGNGKLGTYQTVNGTIVDLDEVYDGSVTFGEPGGNPSVTFTDVSPIAAPRVIFNARGMANTEGTVFLKNTKDNYYRVRVMTSGVIQIEKRVGTAWE